MKFNKIKIVNYKGIEETELELLNSPRGNVYTLVGINESGKTSILEAINSFEYNSEKSSSAVSNAIKPDLNQIIPIKDKANFNGSIELITTLDFEEEDYKELCSWTKDNCNFNISNVINKVTVTQNIYIKIQNLRKHQIYGICLYKERKLDQSQRKLMKLEKNNGKNVLTI